jgi:hypothetical protein
MRGWKGERRTEKQESEEPGHVPRLLTVAVMRGQPLADDSADAVCTDHIVVGHRFTPAAAALPVTDPPDQASAHFHQPCMFQSPELLVCHLSQLAIQLTATFQQIDPLFVTVKGNVRILLPVVPVQQVVQDGGYVG